MKTIHITSHNLVEQLDLATVKQARALRAEGVDPHLAVVAVGDTALSPYVRAKQRRGHELGVEVSIYQLPITVNYSDLESVINFINDDPEVSGAIVQLPLPSTITGEQRNRVLTLLAVAKDVDALSGGCSIASGPSIEQLIKHATAKKRFVPTTAAAMLLLAAQESLDLSKSVVVVGKGALVGKPLHALLQAMKVPHSWVDKTTADYLAVIKSADVIFAGTDTDKPFLTKKTVKSGVAILAAGNEIDHESVDGWAARVSAKVGCVGPLTVSLLLSNVVNTTKWQQ